MLKACLVDENRKSAQEQIPHKSGVRPTRGAWPAQRYSGGGAAARSIWAEVPAADGNAAVWCYVDRRSYVPGEAIRLMVSATVKKVDIRIFKDGAVPDTIMRWAGVDVDFQPVPQDVYKAGCGWADTVIFTLPPDVVPGAYIVEVRDGELQATEPALAHHIFFVRSETPNPDAIVLIATTCTWTAYNDWGGANHYRGLAPDYPQGASPQLSTMRPWARGLVWLPPGAPRAISSVRQSEPQPPRYEFMDWAYANGYTRYYAAAGWASFEGPFVRWAEEAGYVVHVIAQEDLELHPECLQGYRCAVVVGHDEYWSQPMRDTVDQFVDGGGNVARFAGNFMWQIRLEDDGKTQTCYKYQARDRDPLRHTDPARMTSAWEDPLVGRPGATTFGVNGCRGQYVGMGHAAPRSPRGFQVFRTRHWSLEGTGLGYGDMFGSEAGIVAVEVDGLEYTFADGLPVPTGVDQAPPGLEIVAMAWATLAEDGLPEHVPSHFFADTDARFATWILDGSDAPEDIQRRSRGSCMMVSFRRGNGEVFGAATCEWVLGLMKGDFYTQRITNNVLRRFLR